MTTLTSEQLTEQTRILKEGTGIEAYNFAKDTPGADIPALQARLLKAAHDARLIYHIPQNTAMQERVMNAGNDAEAYKFAKNIPGADVAAMQALVLEASDARVIYKFAKNIPGADITALYERAQSIRFFMLKKDEIEAFKGLLDAQQPDSSSVPSP